MGLFDKFKKKEEDKTIDDRYFDALYYMRKRDMKTKLQGFEIIKSLAMEGEIRAQVIAGEFCDYVLKQPEEAFKWFKMAMDAGDQSARYYYAGMLLRGEPVKKNRKLAIEMYQEMAAEGVCEASFILGQLAEEEHRYDKAYAWYEKAYHQGYDKAQKKIKQLKKDGHI